MNELMNFDANQNQPAQNRYQHTTGHMRLSTTADGFNSSQSVSGADIQGE